MLKKKLAIVTTHPIQYNAPFFRQLAKQESLELIVFYTWSQTEHSSKYDPDFGMLVDWDIPLLEGYSYTFVKNISINPGSNRFCGIINPTLIKEIRDFNPDAILVYGWNFISHLSLMLYFKGKSIWFRGDSTLLDDEKRSPFKKWIRRFILSKVYKFVDKVFYVGTHNKAYYISMGINESQLIHAPHAVDNEHFSSDDESRKSLAEKWRTKLSISADSKVLLFVGKIEAKKNPTGLINSFMELNSKHLHLLIVGEGPQKIKLKSMTKEIQNIHWLGFINQQEMPVVYRMADLLILPSIGPGETWGLCLNEAMASGRAIAVSRNCGAAVDLVEEERTGWSFNPENMEDLNSLLKKLTVMTRSNLLEKGQAAGQKIEQFSYQTFCLSILNALVTKHASN